MLSGGVGVFRVSAGIRGAAYTVVKGIHGIDLRAFTAPTRPPEDRLNRNSVLNRSTVVNNVGRGRATRVLARTVTLRPMDSRHRWFGRAVSGLCILCVQGYRA